MGERIAVAVLGAKTIYREALHQLLSHAGFEVVFSGEVSDRSELQHAPAPDILLLVGDEWAPKALIDYRRRFPQSKIVLLNNVFDYHRLQAAFEADVAGFLLKEMTSDGMLSSLRLVALGEKVFPSQLANALRRQSMEGVQGSIDPSQHALQLSPREMEIVRCLVAGLSNREIAERLAIAEATVKVHVKGILRKLGLANRTQAALWGVANGLGGLAPDGAPHAPHGSGAPSAEFPRNV